MESSNDGSGIVALVILAGLLWFAIWLFGLPGRMRRKRETQRRQELFVAATQVLHRQVEAHKSALVTKRRQLITQDAYGNYVLKAWIKEANYFWSRNIARSLDNEQIALLEAIHQPVVWIEETLEILGVDLDDLRARFVSNDPVEFERYCAELLQSEGWDARTTLSSNDQGADVIATKDGLRIVLQCKLYTNAVGNAAVQEVVAARAHEQAHAAAVVTNSRYTSAAIKLAETNGVSLLHHEGLQEWARQIEFDRAG